ncbi:hypothetical protein SY83_17565 [Paenibacillus swuensis]|uniref:Dihydrofolate reductase n=1 Tax=Paenibacillus swuensis TaxID=1178515 RepID=A0A172TLY5_9BACL|nr:dihydrofolate reductase [Paenibacillus swuensis]ANE47793.1 hypothetical protein SY83_17565 [Paenibacillus swuensis]
MKYNITLIAAIGKNREIGKDNQLLWKLPADMAYFRRTTMGNPILMGRKTFESFGAKALPGRENVVLTTNRTYQAADSVVVHSVEEAMDRFGDKHLYVIGGAEIYRQLLPYAGTVLLTEIDAVFHEADTFFPPLTPEEWTLNESVKGEHNEKNPYDYNFNTYLRIS